MSGSLLGGEQTPTPTPTPNQTPAPTPAPSVTIPENWKESLPEELRNDPSLTSILDIGSLAKSYIHGQKMIGKDKIVIPDKFATEDDWGNIYKKLGVPDSVDKYEFKTPEGVSEDFLKGFKEMAVKSGIHPRQAEKLFDFYNQFTTTANENIENESKRIFEESVSGLKKEWGQGYDRKLQSASNLFNSLADDDTKKIFNDSGLGNNPAVIKLFAKMAETMGEDKYINAENSGSMGLTPAEAQEKINKIFGNKDHPYFNKSHPSHKDALSEMSKLFESLTVKR